MVRRIEGLEKFENQGRSHPAISGCYEESNVFLPYDVPLNRLWLPILRRGASTLLNLLR